jgi:hypothetical protein
MDDSSVLEEFFRRCEKRVNGEVLLEKSEGSLLALKDGSKLRMQVHTRCIDARCCEESFVRQDGVNNFECSHSSLAGEEATKFDQVFGRILYNFGQNLPIK